MCLPFGAPFREIWYSDRGFSSETKKPNYINWVYFGQIIVKSTQFDPNWVLFFRKWYTDGWEIWQKIGIEIVRFLRSGRHIHVRFWWKNPPPPGKYIISGGSLWPPEIYNFWWSQGAAVLFIRECVFLVLGNHYLRKLSCKLNTHNSGPFWYKFTEIYNFWWLRGGSPSFHKRMCISGEP